MFRFIAVMWNDASDTQREVAGNLVTKARQTLPRLTCSPIRDGLIVIHDTDAAGPARLRLLAARRGCIFGQLFRKDAAGNEALRQVAIDEAESDRIVSTIGQHLIDCYWGRYVAFIRDPATGTTQILRDPSGGVPCLLTSRDQVHVAFSDMEDYLRLGLKPLSVNWRYVHAFLTGREVQSAATGVNEVQQVRQGERLALSTDGQTARQLAWNPMLISLTQRLDDPRVAIERARETARTCIAALAECHEAIVLRYSAGFDSTIVLNCLHRAASQPRLTCLHYFDPPSTAAELDYLHRALDAATNHQREEVELLMVPRTPEKTRVDALLGVRPFAFPQHYRNRLTSEPLDCALAEERGAALFDGVYGNQLFLTDTLYASMDYLFDHPSTRQSAPRGSLEHEPVAVLWEAFSNALRLGLLDTRRTAVLTPQDHQLLNADVVNALRDDPQDYMSCYWAQQSLIGGPPGKLSHIRDMCLPADMNSSHLPGEAADRVTPLISQPLMELFLQIPTYVLNYGGMDRGIARAAFADALPAELLDRSMMEIGHRFNQSELHRIVLRQNEKFIFETLLDGALAGAGFLNRQLAERDLVNLREDRCLANVELLETFLDAEVWLRSLSINNPIT